jgi:hypothetical protein
MLEKLLSVEHSFKSKLKTTGEFGCAHDIIRKHSLHRIQWNLFQSF